jgi:hypothetical protein
VRALLGRDDWCVTDKRVVDTWVWHKIGLELVQVDIESSVEAQTRGDRADNLSNQTIEMLVVWTGNIETAAANVIDSLVVDEERAVGVLNSAVGGENRIVGLDNGGGDARSGIHGKFELALLAVVGRKTLEEKSSKTRPGTTTKRVEDEETLEGGAIVCPQSAQEAYGVRTTLTSYATNAIDHTVDHLLANGVVATSICFCQPPAHPPSVLATHSCWQHPLCR